MSSPLFPAAATTPSSPVNPGTLRESLDVTPPLPEASVASEEDAQHPPLPTLSLTSSPLAASDGFPLPLVPDLAKRVCAAPPSPSLDDGKQALPVASKEDAVSLSPTSSPVAKSIRAAPRSPSLDRAKHALPVASREDAELLSPRSSPVANPVGTVAHAPSPDSGKKAPFDLLARLEVFRGYACAGGPWFAVSMVPRRTDWEVVYGNRRMTALSYLGKPIAIWVVGDLVSINIYIGAQVDNPCVRLSLSVKDERDRVALTDIRRIVHPETPSHGDSMFKAISLGGDAGKKTLKEIYDATTSFESRDVMARLAPTALNVGDVVLAECWFVRKELLGEWQTAFHLTSISRLHENVTTQTSGAPPSFVSFPWKI
ncbi:uncharacterized protein TRAVEDRAFT_50896 [Trametes versicolor FP-101664 SS1]|uniref:uncharacterized protein n=1 Tax=Trametes versicolor (strain FP-101664) TaxID=717944 RepID=UPI00046236C4|nr:uncharacterized protein TRAVEDRAFT_50896 [Trametes versicolor FP-101664 SS1]EIW54758.1 hypothetical protein TRAVEDRAFT_50896 [Trametes versicolor FP-101664 SS1]